MVYNKRSRKTRRRRRRKGGVTLAEKTQEGVGELAGKGANVLEYAKKFQQWTGVTAAQAGEEFDKEKKGSLSEQIGIPKEMPSVPGVGGKRRKRRRSRRKRTRRKRRKSLRKSRRGGKKRRRRKSRKRRKTRK